MKVDVHLILDEQRTAQVVEADLADVPLPGEPLVIEYGPNLVRGYKVQSRSWRITFSGPRVGLLVEQISGPPHTPPELSQLTKEDGA